MMQCGVLFQFRLFTVVIKKLLKTAMPYLLLQQLTAFAF